MPGTAPAYEYYLDNNFNANTWDNNNTGTPLPSYHYNRVGASGGGPIIPKNILGGKTYFFANYEGFRWNNSTTYREGRFHSADMRAGILTSLQCRCRQRGRQYNLNTGTQLRRRPATAACDPRGLGINSLVQQMWNKFEPAAE